MLKKITVLGSTGSIGKNTVKLIASSPKRFTAQALTTNRNIDLLAKQATLLQAKLAVVADKNLYSELKLALSGTNIRVEAGLEGLKEAAQMENDLVVSAIVGIAGLMPTMAAIEKGTNIALANKECLVCAGDIMMSVAKINQVKIIPVDSEHSAIFQLLEPDHITVERVILTASGGPFRQYTQEQMRHITKEEALNHPTWQMGNKNTIDSATMINKALELIEAHYLFDLPVNKLDVIIHPESIIHSMVEYIDGAVLAQLSIPDMCVPISYALNWPSRGVSNAQKMDFASLGKLTFERVDYYKFPAMKMAKEILKTKGALPIIMSVSNEEAVGAFIADRIKFADIVTIIEEALCKLSDLATPTNIEQLLAIEEITRNTTIEIIKKSRANIKAA